MSLSTLQREAPGSGYPAPATLLVIWQHPVTRWMDPVARLDRDPSGYRLRYLARTHSVAGFRPLLGFSDLAGDYRSPSLFTLFAGRAMSPRRPDYRSYREALGLDALEGPWEELARSQGTQVMDTLQLFAVPSEVAPGEWACRFLVHGIRHVRAARTPDVEDRIDQLGEGDPLLLVDDAGNEHNPRAVLTADGGGHALGWVPNFLLDHLAQMRDVAEPAVEVARTNPRDVPGHLRLTALLRGRAHAAYAPFRGDGYEPLA